MKEGNLTNSLKTWVCQHGWVAWYTGRMRHRYDPGPRRCSRSHFHYSYGVNGAYSSYILRVFRKCLSSDHWFRKLILNNANEMHPNIYTTLSCLITAINYIIAFVFEGKSLDRMQPLRGIINRTALSTIDVRVMYIKSSDPSSDIN